jgi:23S rRNA (cytosine1962-C5)-methyltransferase
VNLVRLELERGLGRHLRAGHPWVYRKALQTVPRIPPGSIVDLTEGGKFVARGYFDPLSPIAVRVLTRDAREVVDGTFFERRVSAAWELRQKLLDRTETDSFRVVHGEADGLPGVVADLYAGTAVLKLYSAGLTSARSLVVEALRKTIPGLRAVLGRDETGREDGEDDRPSGARLLWGEEPPDPVVILERGVRFGVDVHRGQKTGFFLDQRENRSLVRRLARGVSVLNCFSFTGGFSVNAAMGGARRVFSVDQDAEAIALARQNFERNGLDPNAHDFLAADVFELVSSLRTEGRRFGMVILDPPAFAKSQRAVQAAIDGYASLNRQALDLVEPGGLLVTASCSARVSAEAFQGAVKEAGFKAGVDLTLVEERFQAPDHPIRLQFPEGRYLKLLVLQVKPW